MYLFSQIAYWKVISEKKSTNYISNDYVIVTRVYEDYKNREKTQKVQKDEKTSFPKE